MKSNLISYFEQMINARKYLFPDNEWPYSCFEDFVLRNGREFKNNSKKKIKRGKMKECFKNAFHFAKERNLTYCEGFAISSIGFPVLHAWCIDHHGNVYDPTWKDGIEYFGIPFKMEYILMVMLKRKSYGVIDNMENDFPLLSGKDSDFKDERG